MRTPSHLAPRTLVALSLVLASSAVHADAEDTFSITPAYSLMHDNNLFRLTSGKLSEDVSTASLALKVNKQYSLQRFELQASYVDYRYQNYSYLSYNATPYSAAWRWSLTPELHGNLSADSATTIQNFADYQGSQRNLNTTKNNRFDAVYDMSPSWHLLAGVSNYSYENTQFTQGQGNNRVNRVEAGLRRSFSSGSELSYIARSGRGEYFNRTNPIPAPVFADTEFDTRENELHLTWLITGKTAIDARLAYLENSYSNFPSRDFSGTVGSINVNWNITGGAYLSTTLAHDLASYQTVNNNYTSTDRLALMPIWQIDAKMTLRGSYSYARQDYLGAPGIFASSGRSDTLRNGMIGLEWQALRSALISTTLQTERRSSNQSGLDYDDKIANISAQITF